MWKKTKVSQFLFEREGKYKPCAPEIAGLKRIDKIDFQGNFHIGNKPSNTNMILVKNGDLVISGINVEKGALGIYGGTEAVTATIHYSSYTFDEKQIHIEYLKRFLKSPKFIELLKEQVRGGIKTEIKPKHLLALEIPLPSITEQENIIDEFKRIETEYYELKEEIIYQKDLIRKLRQQILEDAIEGKLTADWREKNPDVDPAKILLNRIASEKERLVKEKKIKKQKFLTTITQAEKTFSLPKGWEWCRLSDLGELRGGGTPSKSINEYWDGSIPWICPKDMKKQYLNKSIFQITEKAIKNSSAKLIPSKSILFVVRGMILSHTFPVAINTVPTTVNQDMKALIPHLQGKNLEQFLHLLLSGKSRYILKKVRTSTHGTCRLESEIYSNLVIGLPSLEEQKVITAKVEELFSICDQLEEQVIQNQESTTQLMQAVLKEAFTHKIDITQTASNIVEFKPANNKKIDYYKRTLLAAEIVNQMHREPTLGHLKLQKMIFLCQKTQNMELPTNFLQQAAGPYDPKMARSLDKQLKEKQWFSYHKSESLKYQSLANAGTHKEDFEKYFENDIDAIQHLINLFKTKKSNEMEAVATLYACWEEILNDGVSFSKTKLIEKFYDWSEEKRKFSKYQLQQVIKWMEQHGIFPRKSGAT